MDMRKVYKATTTTVIVIGIILVISFVTAKFDFDLTVTNKPTKEIVFMKNEQAYTYNFSGIPEVTQLKNSEERRQDNLKFGENYYIIEKGASISLESTSGEIIEIPHQVMQNTLTVSQSLEQALFITSGNGLILLDVSGKEINMYSIDDGVTACSFTGKGKDIVYLKDSTFYYSSGGYKNEIDQQVYKMVVADDSKKIFYLKNIGEGGVLMYFNEGKEKMLEVFTTDLVYGGSGYIVYIKNGTIYYSNGKSDTNTGIQADEFVDTTYFFKA
ncbi:MAG: hypothetical protein ACRCW1_00360 [Anaerotignaceae bacterium]